MVETSLNDTGTEEIRVLLADGDSASGLASMLQQYFEQNIRDFPVKRSQASKLRGKIVVEATEGDVAVTLIFKGQEIELKDGSDEDAYAHIRAGFLSLSGLAAGTTDPVSEVLAGKLRFRPSWRHPLFPFKVLQFMRLPADYGKNGGDELQSAGRKKALVIWISLAVLASALVAVTAYIVSR